MGRTEVRIIVVYCDVCRRSVATSGIPRITEEKPPGWTTRTLHGCGMTGYSRSELRCPDCSMLSDDEHPPWVFSDSPCTIPMPTEIELW